MEFSERKQMARPRKNPDDPKWSQPEQTDVKLVLYAVSLAGVIAASIASCAVAASCTSHATTCITICVISTSGISHSG